MIFSRPEQRSLERLRYEILDAGAASVGVGIGREERGLLHLCNEPLRALVRAELELSRELTLGEGMSAEEVASIFHDPQEFKAWHEESVLMAPVVRDRGRFVTKRGRVLEIRLTPHPRHHPEVVVWAVWDRSDQHRGEERLRLAREEAEAANRAKSDFLAMVSHEIRTPLNAILGMTELLLDSSLSRDQRNLLGTVQSSGESLLGIINDILDVSKLESGRMELRKESFALLDLLEGVLEGSAFRAYEKGLELSYSAGGDIPEAVEGDPHRLRQVLVNLVGNAIKFTPKGRVSVSLETLERSEREALVRITVRDTGVGIASEDQERVFEPFVQVAGAQESSRQGTGLGLGIVRSLVKLMGGDVGLESHPGWGSAFTIELPLVLSGKQFPRRRASDRRYPGVTGVIVSGSMELQGAVEGVLGYLGAESARVEAVEELEEVLASLPVDRPIVVFVDHILGIPMMEAAGRVLASVEGERRVALGLLVPPGSPDPWRVEGPASTAYLPKPVTRRSLAGLMQEVDAGEGHDGPVEARESEEPVFLRGVKVLLVEDQAANREYLSRVLRSAGAEVEEAVDGRAGAERFQNGIFDVVLTDLEMPELDGFGLLEEVRGIERRFRRGRVPVAALTAHAVKGYAERCFAAGMDGYLTKPVSRASLLGMVRDLAGRGRSVLVVDDDPTSREVARRILSRRGFRVEGAASGSEAFSLLEARRPDAVLIDMNLPGVRGDEVVRRIRRMPAFAGMPVIAVTGYSEDAEKARCQEAGCTGFMEKPVRWSELVEMLDRFLEEGRKTDGASLPLPPSGGRASPPASVPADLADLATQFLELQRLEVAKARQRMERGELRDAVRLGHNLAGTAGTFGFDPLGELGRSLYDVASEGNARLTEDVLGEIEMYLQDVEWQVVAG